MINDEHWELHPFPAHRWGGSDFSRPGSENHALLVSRFVCILLYPVPVHLACIHDTEVGCRGEILVPRVFLPPSSCVLCRLVA